MAKDPAFLFYSSDFLTGTMFMSNEQIGKYIKLLCAQHQQGRLTKDHMMKICQTDDKDIFEKFTEDENGLWYNKRLEEEHLKRVAYSKSRADNRRKKKKDMNNISNSYDVHMENENENENIIENRSKKFIKEVNSFSQFSAIAKEFILYWTEPNKSKTKLKFELQKTWDTKRRLERWASNDFGKKKQPEAIKVQGLTEEERLAKFGPLPDYSRVKGTKSIKELLK